MKTFGEKIEQLRKEKGITQAGLAESIQGSREAVGKYERNEMLPSLEVALKIADALGTTVGFLVDEDALPLDQKLVKRLKAIEGLEEDEQTSLLRVIDAYLRDAKTRKEYTS